MNPHPAAPSVFEMLLPFLFIFVIFYFFIIRPQSKRLKQQEQLLKELKKGDAVVTQAGILGVIDGITDLVVTLDLGNGTKMKVLRKHILGLQEKIIKTNET